MELAPPRPRRRARESVVPMINVVFLLLVFFLMTATLAPPAPFRVTPPAAEGGAPVSGRAALQVSADGRLAYAGRRGEAAVSALSRRPAGAGPLRLRADADLPAADLARLLRRLAGAGVGEVALVTVRR
jgi:biopolymer transport protein ExbD